MNSTEVVPILQVAIGPVILISAVGLLLLTLNNRLSHAIDRARGLAHDAETAENLKKSRLFAQIRILWKRMRLIRRSMFMAAMSALFAAILIMAMFFIAVSHLPSQWLIVLLFILSLSSLVGSLSLLILDVDSALVALKLELDINVADLESPHRLKRGAS